MMPYVGRAEFFALPALGFDHPPIRRFAYSIATRSVAGVVFALPTSLLDYLHLKVVPKRFRNLDRAIGLLVSFD